MKLQLTQSEVQWVIKAIGSYRRMIDDDNKEISISPDKGAVLCDVQAELLNVSDKDIVDVKWNRSKRELVAEVLETKTRSVNPRRRKPLLSDKDRIILTNLASKIIGHKP